MHIYRLETIGSLDGLVAREEAPPVPSAGEVLVRVKASALNFRDLAILLGKSPFPVRPGVVPISDAAGEVAVSMSSISSATPYQPITSPFSLRCGTRRTKCHRYSPSARRRRCSIWNGCPVGR